MQAGRRVRLASASALMMPSSTSQRASFATRSTLSAIVPSFSWKTMPSSFFACSSSGTLRSCSQKKRASDSRAASTRALPSTIAAPPSLRRDIGDAHERRREQAFIVRAREIFLVGAHGEHDHLARHIEEVGVEAAEQWHRPFGQSRILDDQALVRKQRQPGTPPRPLQRPRGSAARAPPGRR